MLLSKGKREKAWYFSLAQVTRHCLSINCVGAQIPSLVPLRQYLAAVFQEGHGQTDEIR